MRLHYYQPAVPARTGNSVPVLAQTRDRVCTGAGEDPDAPALLWSRPLRVLTPLVESDTENTWMWEGPGSDPQNTENCRG